MVLDAAGDPLTERVRFKMPDSPAPAEVMGLLAKLVKEVGDFERVACGFPGVVIEGEIRTAVNLHPGWVGMNLAAELEALTGKPARVANDADVQGMAVIAGQGVELVVTLGTGMGAARYTNGHLVPNLELGHHPFRGGKTYEECLGEAALKDKGLKKWNKRIEEAIGVMARIFNFHTLYLGGGNARKISLELPPNVKIVPNVAGLLGGIHLWAE